jgi:hypothetical protein
MYLLMFRRRRSSPFSGSPRVRIPRPRCANKLLHQFSLVNRGTGFIPQNELLRIHSSQQVPIKGGMAIPLFLPKNEGPGPPPIPLRLKPYSVKKAPKVAEIVYT